MSKQRNFAIYYCIILVCFFYNQLSWAGLFEVSGDFSYSKSYFGVNRENTSRKRIYSGTIAYYFFHDMTGLELKYSHKNEIVTINDVSDFGSGISIYGTQNQVNTKVQGIGLRQALNSMNGFIIPVISLGYAQQVIKGKTSYNIDDNGLLYILEIDQGVDRNNAVFGTFTLKFKFSRLFSIDGSVNTVFEAFKYNEAKNNITYTAGISWIF